MHPCSSNFSFTAARYAVDQKIISYHYSWNSLPTGREKMLLEKERAVNDREDKVTRYLPLNYFLLNQWHTKLTHNLANKRSLCGISGASTVTDPFTVLPYSRGNIFITNNFLKVRQIFTRSLQL